MNEDQDLWDVAYRRASERLSRPASEEEVEKELAILMAS